MGRALVLGGSGFIGAHLTASLARQGYLVTAVGRRPRPHPPAPSVTLATMDLYDCSREALEGLLAGVTVVYHLAWSSFAATAEQNPAVDLVDNVGFFVRLLDSLKSSDATLVFCSSGGTVYGPAKDRPIVEDHVLAPVTAYGAGKVAAETYAETFRRAHGLDVRIARLANPFGLGQDPDRLQGALTRFAAHAVRGLPIEVWGDGSVVRDYLHIDDAVEALRRIGEAPREMLSDKARVFNVGSGRGASLKDLIWMIERRLDCPLRVSFSPGRSTDVSWNVLDIRRIEQTLGWRPALTLEQGVDRLLGELGGGREDEAAAC